jgi:hypothetical protein
VATKVSDGTDAGHPAGEVEGGGAAGDRDGVLDAGPFGELLLERLGARPHRQPARPQAVEHGLNIRIGDVDLDQGLLPVHQTSSSTAASTRSICSSVRCGNSGRLNCVREASSVWGRERPGKRER